MPAFRFEKALSVGANKVRPWFELLLSWAFILSLSCVTFRILIKVLNWPAFSSIFVMLAGPAGAGPCAAV